jgi:predicted phosphodiesterase
LRILIVSDMHTEFWKNGNSPVLPPILEPYDIVVAAGDIGLGTYGLNYVSEVFPDHRIIYVPGNHEYYRHEYHELNDQLANRANELNIDLLNPGTVEIDGWKFIGANLWTDFKLQGYLEMQDYNLQGFADFNLIRFNDGRMTRSTMKQIHQLEKQYIISELEKSVKRVPGLGVDVGNQKTIVITHFVPSQLAVHPKWHGNTNNPYFTNDLDDLMDRFGYPVHIFGHTHDRFDSIHPCETRLVANPLGYPGENREPYQWKIIEV